MAHMRAREILQARRGRTVPIPSGIGRTTSLLEEDLRVPRRRNSGDSVKEALRKAQRTLRAGKQKAKTNPRAPVDWNSG